MTAHFLTIFLGSVILQYFWGKKIKSLVSSLKQQIMKPRASLLRLLLYDFQESAQLLFTRSHEKKKKEKHVTNRTIHPRHN